MDDLPGVLKLYSQDEIDAKNILYYLIMKQYARIHRRFAASHLKVEMRAGGSAGVA